MNTSCLKDKSIILGVTGGIAAYKAVELMRLFTKAGARVQVVLTRHAAQFIPPLTFETLSQQRVITDLFAEKPLTHLRAVEEADLMVIAPATANVLAKLHHGVADDALTTMALAYRGPQILAPAMNENMLHHPATRENLTGLAQRHQVHLVQPESGALACAQWGEGRLAAVEKIFHTAIELLTESERLAGLKILVTAGPTREPLDPVRYLTNRSSGKMGYALAAGAARRGAKVVLISGPTHLRSPQGVELIAIETASEMSAAVKENFRDCNVLIMSAAVADYRPVKPSYAKIKKGSGKLALPLERTPDILTEILTLKKNQLVVGFALETEDLFNRAQAKLKDKDLDLVVANLEAALGSDSSEVLLIDRDGEVRKQQLQAKEVIAGLILDKIKKLREGEKHGEKTVGS